MILNIAIALVIVALVVLTVKTLDFVVEDIHSYKDDEVPK